VRKLPDTVEHDAAVAEGEESLLVCRAGRLVAPVVGTLDHQGQRPDLLRLGQALGLASYLGSRGSPAMKRER